MSLSFREQAAIALMASQAVEAARQNEDPETLAKYCAISADLLAEACCAKWGHDYGYNADDPSFRPASNVSCKRCGAK